MSITDTNRTILVTNAIVNSYERICKNWTDISNL